MFVLLTQPYRPLALIVLGIWLWSLNVAFLKRLGVAVEQMLGLAPQRRAVIDEQCTSRSSSSSSTPATLNEAGIMQLAMLLSAVIGVYALADYLVVSADRTDDFGSFWASSLCLLTIFAVVLWPLKSLMAYPERLLFARSLYRIVSVTARSTVYFSDVLLADVLTSFARTIESLMCGTVGIFTESYWSRTECSSTATAHILVALPFYWRLRQCINEYRANRIANRAQRWNAIKYASAFPVLALGYCSRIYPSQSISIAWGFFSFFNTAFSLYWDVAHDWDLGHWRCEYPFLRDQLLIDFGTNSQHSPLPQSSADSASSPLDRSRQGQPLIYYSVLLVNAVARFAWAIRLYLVASGVEMDEINTLFTLQLIEILRRWLWLFLRIEKQYLQCVDDDS